jgi:hypothetical protein
MRKKTVLKVVLLICVVLISVIPANATTNIIFSDDFSGWRVDVNYPWWPRLPTKWDIFFEGGAAVTWFDIGYEWLDPNVDANDRKLVVGQSDTLGTSDAWVTTTAYYDVEGCSLLNISLEGMRQAEDPPDPNIIGPVCIVKVSYWDSSMTPKGEASFTVIDHNTPREIDPNAPGIWITYDANVPVPAGAKVAKFHIINDSNDGSHGTGWFDNFVVRDPVCVNRPLTDFNRDCKVNFSDLAELALQWHQCGLVIQGSVHSCW